MKINTVTKIPTIQDFAAALERGEQAIREAASILCQMVDADPDTYQKLHKAIGTPWNVLGNLERVGRGSMHYRLLFDSSPASRYIELLPASKQAEVYDKGVQIVRVDGSKRIVEQKPVQDLTPREARVVFDVERIRTVEEQIKVAKAPEVKPSKAAQRYIITDDGGHIEVFARSVFSLSQLEDILERMKTKAIKNLATKKR